MCAYAAENLRKKWFTGEEHINSLTLRKGQDLKRGPALFYPEIVSAVLEKGRRSAPGDLPGSMKKSALCGGWTMERSFPSSRTVMQGS